MSERILKALMQLFAIIAKPDSNKEERRTVVGAFLKQQLNTELVNEYLTIFDKYYDEYQKKQSENKIRKTIALSSVKVLKICTQINVELTLKQKIIVVIRLLEFIKSDFEEITEQELEFVETVSDTFNIENEEFIRLKAFILYSFERTPNSSRILQIDNIKSFNHEKVKHIYSENLNGQIRVFNVSIAHLYLFRYLGENELYLNSQLVHSDKVYALNPGSSIRNPKIKPIYYGDIISAFFNDNERTKLVFQTKELDYTFKGGKKGLNNISFTQESGHLVGIMGASGAGKSTLLNVLNGSSNPSSGEVLINGINIHSENDKIEGLIGHVSQDDLLIEDLTVFQNLYYNTKLCYDNISKFQLVRIVLRTLQNLGLYEIKDMKVGSPMNKKISGGQRKRLNIALELIREPSVLFLDEPTSGLSSRDSENIMDLLKELALKGKLVFVVIHQPSSDIFKLFDSLLILDTGGYLIYDGNPVDSITYFKSRTHQANWSEAECSNCGNVNPEQVFNIVESHVLDEYGKQTYTRKISPEEWQVNYEEYIRKTKTEEPSIPNQLPEILFKIPSKIRQFKVFVIRDVLAKFANKQYLVINLLEAPILSFFLSYIIRYYSVDALRDVGYTYSENSNIPVYIFMAVIVAIFMGLTVSAEEIIKDQLILKRERFLNLSWGSYLFSKVAILLIISAFQALTFILLGNLVLEIRGMFWQYWLVLFTVWAVAILFGLNISNSFKTAVTIYILIPFLVIPNIILSGIIVKYDKLNPDVSSPNSIPFYGELIPARWAYEGLAVYQYINNVYEKKFYNLDKIISTSNYKKDYWLVTLDNKLNTVRRNIGLSNKIQSNKDDLLLIRNELSKELKENKRFIFNELDNLNIEKIDDKTFASTKKLFNEIKDYYIKKSKKAGKQKDLIISNLQNTEKSREAFILLKKSYFNELLSDFVRNKDAIGIVEYNHKLYRKIDPIYQDSEHPFIKSHFYSPNKNIFSYKITTFWMNIIVLWFMTIMLFITLYFKIFSKFINMFGKVYDRLFGEKE